MLKVTAMANVYYTCFLSEEDENKVRNYSKENNISLDESTKELWDNFDIDIYAGEVIESECDTQEVSCSEFNI